jgi:replicative DNA helicase
MMIEKVESNQVLETIYLSEELRDFAFLCISTSNLASIDSALKLIWDNHTTNLALECGQTVKQFIQTSEIGESYFVKMQNILNDYNAKIIKKDGFENISEVLASWFANKINKVQDNKPYKLPILGLEYLEVSNGELVSIVARTKSGKTTFLTQIALDCINHNTPVLFFTLEDTKSGIIDKLLALKIGVNLKTMQLFGSPNFIDNSGVETRLTKAISEIEQSRIGFVDGVNIGLGDIRAIISKFNSKYPNGVVIIDQLQKIKHKELNKVIRYDAIVENLKNQAQEFKVKIFLAHQLNREIEKESGRFPTTSDIKDCGRIEEGSDLIVMFAKEDEKTNADRLCTVVSRHFPGKKTRLKWEDALVKFKTA